MRKIRLLIALLLIAGNTFAAQSYDLIIVGGNPGGITAAIAAARLGKTSLILERTNLVGGLPANGLGATDIATRNATTGLFKEYVDRMKNYYMITFGKDSPQLKDCSDGYHFEPSVATKIFDQMLSEHKDKITILTMRQFDSQQGNIEMHDNNIKSIRVLNRLTQAIETYSGRVFLDATYEGDLGAAANVPYRVGREGKEEFNEVGAGKIYKYWDGAVGDGSTHLSDNAVQAYNYRLCLTRDQKNRVAFKKPTNYNRAEFVSLIEDVWTGANTNFTMAGVTKEMMEHNRRRLAAGDTTQIPGDPWGIAKLTNMVLLPNGKTDANNQHLAFISTDLPEENWAWPTASWEWRDRFAVRLKEYIQGLLWFAQSDSELPMSFRKAVSEWGFAKDEYSDNANFPRQVYVREGRRFEGVYFFTANDALPVSLGARPPLHGSSITASHYALDSHATSKRESNRIHLDGFLSYPSAVYTVPYGVIVPKKVDNLLLPVPVSGSHIGFSTLRMEPCWMAMGQAAGVAAAIAIDSAVKVQNVDMETLQRVLIEQKATLIYYKDISIDDPDYRAIQYLGLKGYLPDWRANLNDKINQSTLNSWQRLSGVKLDAKAGETTRRDAIKQIYKSIGSQSSSKK